MLCSSSAVKSGQRTDSTDLRDLKDRSEAQRGGKEWFWIIASKAAGRGFNGAEF